jgi:hypothetical protein
MLKRSRQETSPMLRASGKVIHEQVRNVISHWLLAILYSNLEALTRSAQMALVKIFEECSGQPFQVEYVPIEVLQTQRASAEHTLQLEAYRLRGGLK